VTGRPQGGFKSDKARAAYWRMQYESAVGALADLIAENTENVELMREVVLDFKERCCETPAPCSCSMGRMAQLVREE
jgi:hypothetical protein